MSDFRATLRMLKEEMEEQQNGPYHLRPSCQTLVRWVTLAGGSVRGIKQTVGGGMAGKWILLLVYFSLLDRITGCRVFVNLVV